MVMALDLLLILKDPILLIINVVAITASGIENIKMF